jgi:hypothetical protein
VVSSNRGYGSDCFVPYEDLRATFGEEVSRTVEVQEYEPAWWASKVVYSGDGFLSAVAALVQVYGGA